jgi:hypothetical protein
VKGEKGTSAAEGEVLYVPKREEFQILVQNHLNNLAMHALGNCSIHISSISATHTPRPVCTLLGLTGWLPNFRLPDE